MNFIRKISLFRRYSINNFSVNKIILKKSLKMPMFILSRQPFTYICCQ